MSVAHLKWRYEMKRLMIALASATALLASSAMAQEKIKIGAAPYGLNAEFMQIWAAALQEHPAVKSGEVELTVFDGRYDALVQQDQFKTMVTQKYNAIIFAADRRRRRRGGRADGRRCRHSGHRLEHPRQFRSADLLCRLRRHDLGLHGSQDRARQDRLQGQCGHPRGADRPVGADFPSRRQQEGACRVPGCQDPRRSDRQTGRAPKPRR